MKETNPLDRLVARLNADAHEDEATALKLVDFLMREYGFTHDPLTDDAQGFANDLRGLVAQWISGQKAERFPNLLPVIQWLESGGDPKEAAMELRIYQASFYDAANYRLARLIDGTVADSLREALTELRDRIKAHPAYAELTEEEENDVGGDAAELSYLARVADAALLK
jgi:hypothetical protein